MTANNQNELREEIAKRYGNKIRLRACGCLIKNNKILLLKHDGIGSRGFFWNVPGGEPEKNESLEEAVKREFLEETKLYIKVEKLLTIQEFIDPPLHAIEYYFMVSQVGGEASLGFDPENVNILSELKWFDKNEFDILNENSKPSFLINKLNFD